MQLKSVRLESGHSPFTVYYTNPNVWWVGPTPQTPQSLCGLRSQQLFSSHVTLKFPPTEKRFFSEEPCCFGKMRVLSLGVALLVATEQKRQHC